MENINYHIKVGLQRSEAILYYNQTLDHLKQVEQQNDLHKSRAIVGNQSPLTREDETYKGSNYNVMVEWETVQIMEEPLSLIATHAPFTCVVYAKDQDLLHVDGWERFKHIAKKQQTLTGAINQTKLRQVWRSSLYQFGLLIPRDYKHALELDNKNGNSKWYDSTKLEMDQIHEYEVFKDNGKPNMDLNMRKVSTAPEGSQKITVHVVKRMTFQYTRKSVMSWNS